MNESPFLLKHTSYNKDCHDECQCFSLSQHIEGCRSRCFRKALCLTAEKYINAIRFRLFEEKFPVIYERYPADLEKLHAQFSTHLHDIIKKRVSKVYVEQNASDVMLFIDSVVEESLVKDFDNDESCSSIGDNTGKDVQSQHRDRLHQYLQKLMQENDLEEKDMMARHEDILALKYRIQDSNRQISKKLDKLNDSILLQTKPRL